LKVGAVLATVEEVNHPVEDMVGDGKVSNLFQHGVVSDTIKGFGAVEGDEVNELVR
jgi:hypothetical protein